MRGLYQSIATALISLTFVLLYFNVAHFDLHRSQNIAVNTPEGEKSQPGTAANEIVETVPVVTTPAGGGDSHKTGDGSKPSEPSEPIDLGLSKQPDSSKKSDRPLITYAYSESASARENIKFFLSQGLHDAADFIFILNGETDISSLIPEKSNIQIIKRPNECFDLGAHGEVLRKDNLWRKYTRFILLNASIRGPFVPYWANRCWSDLFLGRVTDEVKLVGMTANCLPKYHIQSMIWATDSVGIELLLYPPPGSSTPDKYGGADDMVALQGCYKSMPRAIHGEIGATGTIQKAGYKVDAMMAAFHKSNDYQKECEDHPIDDVLWNQRYYGANVHPYETIFMKANRNIDPTLVGLLTDWHLNGTFGGSWDVCS